MAHASPEHQPSRQTRRLLGRALLSAVIAAVGLTVALGLAGGAGDALKTLRQVDPGWLAVGAGAEAVSYLLLGAVLRRLVLPDLDLGRLGALRLALLVFGLGNLTPAAPAEAMVLATAELRRQGVEGRRSLLALVFTGWFGTGVGIVLLALNVFVAIGLGDVRSSDATPLAAIAGALLVLVALVGFLVSRRAVFEQASVAFDRLRFWRPSRPNAQGRLAGARLHADARAVLGTRPDRLTLTLLGSLSWLADTICFAAAMRAAGVQVPYDVVLLAYAAGIIATQVPLLPAGLGVVEAAVPAVLHQFGIPYAHALAGTLAYRVLGTFAPAVAGALGLARLRVLRRRVTSAPPPGPPAAPVSRCGTAYPAGAGEDP